MFDLDEIDAALETQNGVNSATLEILKLVAWAVAARLPEDHRAEFHEMLENIPNELETFRSMPVNSQIAFTQVLEEVSDKIKEIL
ncbi:MAG TPA: hypothetical protein VM577_05935 [Anaerovoracaceae bacterium]|nr:hypothetical protein [Anaerovoracaceae bacterium]